MSRAVSAAIISLAMFGATARKPAPEARAAPNPAAQQFAFERWVREQLAGPTTAHYAWRRSLTWRDFMSLDVRETTLSVSERGEATVTVTVRNDADEYRFFLPFHGGYVRPGTVAGPYGPEEEAGRWIGLWTDWPTLDNLDQAVWLAPGAADTFTLIFSVPGDLPDPVDVVFAARQPIGHVDALIREFKMPSHRCSGR